MARNERKGKKNSTARDKSMESKRGETVIIRPNIILGLEVSWGHGMSLLKYKVKE